ncbi:MAG: hypothetical protein L6V84_03495 [Oscillospiraceae bacterium]|nr:MAG: hypothetical protein L6V84_03495 [Oscillospiraceae bacterium]
MPDVPQVRRNPFRISRTRTLKRRKQVIKQAKRPSEKPKHLNIRRRKTDYNVSAGSETYRGFLMDNILHSDVGDIHFHLYIPESYDKSEPYALYLSLPGYEGLYFQGVGTNIRAEDFVFLRRRSTTTK